MNGSAHFASVFLDVCLTALLCVIITSVTLRAVVYVVKVTTRAVRTPLAPDDDDLEPVRQNNQGI